MGIYAEDQLPPIVAMLNGGSASKLNIVGVNDAANYAVTITNQTPTVGHLNVGGVLAVNSGSVTVSVLNANAINTGTLAASGQITSTVATGTAPLVVASTTKVANLNVDLLDGRDTGTGVGNVAFYDAQGRVADSQLLDGFEAAAFLLLTGGTISGNLTVQGNLTAGDANTDAHTFIGVTTYRNAANTLTQLLVDAGNNRVIVGSGTALGSDTTPALHVVGRLYVAPDSANDLAIQVRRSSAATVGWSLGMTSDNDFVFKDDAGGERFRVGDASSTYQAKVTGTANVTSSLTVGAGISAGASSAFTGGISIVSGGLGVLAGGADIVGTTTVDTLTVDGTGTVFTLQGTSQTQTTVGGAGGASALPATPRGYIKVFIGGANRVIPFFDNA